MTQQIGVRSTPTSTRGPKIMTFSGVAAIVGGLASLAAAIGLFVTALPLDVLTLDGRPGSGVVAVVPSPGSESVTLDAGAYLIYLTAPRVTSPPTLQGAITVTGPGGVAVRVGDPSIDGNVSSGGVDARTVAGFEVPADGDYVITAPPQDSSGARLFVLDDPGLGTFVGQVLGTVGGVFVGIGLGAVGVVLTIWGGIWWHLRRRSGVSPSRS